MFSGQNLCFSRTTGLIDENMSVSDLRPLYCNKCTHLISVLPKQFVLFKYFLSLLFFLENSWRWSYGSWIYNYPNNQCPSPLMLFEYRSGQGVQHYVIKFISDLRQVGGVHCLLRFPPPIKLTATI